MPIMKPQRALTCLVGMLVACAPKASADVGEIVRIPTPIAPRCINAKTDELTVTLRRVITQKTVGFLTEDKRAGVTVLAALNADDFPVAKHPSVNLVSVQNAAPGQVQLPLEYPVASLLRLPQEKTFTKNMQLDIYLDKVRGANSFGKLLDTAGGILAKLPIPANPYTNAANEALKFANEAIANESKDAGGELFASVTLQFNNREEPDINKCVDEGKQATGAIAVIGPKGGVSTPPITLGNLSGKYCWRYVSASTYEVQYAPKPADGCGAVPPAAFQEVPNDYIMLLVSAAPMTTPERILLARIGNEPSLPRHLTALHESAKLCDLMGVSPLLCGVQ